jgi:uncharacterized protein YggL (DUF469 family)
MHNRRRRRKKEFDITEVEELHFEGLNASMRKKQKKENHSSHALQRCMATKKKKLKGESHYGWPSCRRPG